MFELRYGTARAEETAGLTRNRRRYDVIGFYVTPKGKLRVWVVSRG